MGATLTFLHNQPERPDDADNPVRLAWGVPMPPFKAEFERRFGLKLLEGYGSTEGGISVFQQLDKAYPPGSCGEVAPGFRLRILDDDDRELAAGQVGEIVTRPDDRNQMMTGYLRMPEVDAELLRGGWYHTGDLGRLDEAGNLYFVGRKKDVIRRRGENISALEIEHALEAHPAVLEVAAYGIDSPFTEEEVAVAVVLRSGATHDRVGTARLLRRPHGSLHGSGACALPREPAEDGDREGGEGGVEEDAWRQREPVMRGVPPGCV